MDLAGGLRAASDSCHNVLVVCARWSVVDVRTCAVLHMLSAQRNTDVEASNVVQDLLTSNITWKSKTGREKGGCPVIGPHSA